MSLFAQNSSRSILVAYVAVGVAFAGSVSCSEDYVELSIHLNLPVPAEMDAFCLGLSAGGRGQFSQHYPLSTAQSNQAQTLTIETGPHASFEALLRGEKSGMSNTWLRRSLDLSVRSADLGVEKCSARGLGQFGPLQRLTKEPGSFVAGLPVPFAPGLVAVVNSAESRSFAYSQTQLQIAQRRDLFPQSTVGVLKKILAADFSSPRDCFDDLLLVGSSGTALWHNSGEGRFSALPIPAVGSFLDAFAADIDGDSDVDLVLVASDGLRLLVNDGDGLMRDATAMLPQEASLSSPSSIAGIHLVPDDGLVDLVVGRSAPGVSPLILRNGGAASFVAAPNQPALFSTDSSSVTTGDINGDGLTDIAIASAQGVGFALQGTGAVFSGPVEISSSTFNPNSPLGLLLRDVDGDCDVDLSVVDSAGVHILLNTGGGVWAAAQTIPLSVGASNIAYVNFDADEVPDLLIGGRTDGAWWASQTR